MALETKSDELLLVSSLFPINSSVPPIPIDEAVEDELAFLSTLVPPAGSAKEVPSPKVVPGFPILTASITIPAASEPSIIAKLLSLAIVPLPLLSHNKEGLRLVLHQRKKPRAGITSSEVKVTILALVVPLVLLPSLIPSRLMSNSVGL